MWAKIGWPSARNADLRKRSQATVTASQCRPVISLARPPGLRLSRFGEAIATGLGSAPNPDAASAPELSHSPMTSRPWTHERGKSGFSVRAQK
jgi:hypothetical protein